RQDRARQDGARGSAPHPAGHLAQVDRPPYADQAAGRARALPRSLPPRGIGVITRQETVIMLRPGTRTGPRAVEEVTSPSDNNKLSFYWFAPVGEKRDNHID